ncbi:MAG: calcium-binding protein [Paracoccaceae bacterium]
MLGLVILGVVAVAGFGVLMDSSSETIDDSDNHDSDGAGGISSDSSSGGDAEINDEFDLLTSDYAEWEDDEFSTISDINVSEDTDRSEKLVVTNTDAAVSLELGANDSVISFNGQGDTVTVAEDPDGSGRFVSISDGGASVTGGAGDDFLLANKAGNTLDGGGGDDFLYSDKAAANLSGGEGDDTLIGHDAGLFVHTASDAFENFVDGQQDTLSGGEGNDRLIGDGADIFSTGDGQDQVGIYGSGAQVTDFDPLNDRLELMLPEDMSEGAVPVTADSFSFMATNGVLQVFHDGELILSVPDSSDTTVALRDDTAEGGQTILYSNSSTSASIFIKIGN